MDVKEALTISIDYEHKVRDHYAAGAAVILDTQGRKVFETLAKEEQGHVAYLESRLEEWLKTGKIADAELPTVLPSREFIEEARRRVSGAPADTLAVRGELELLKVALELERKTGAFYRELVETLPAEHRELFARFLVIEEGHLAIVQAEIDALAGHGHWFDFMEFQLEAG